MSSLAEIEFQHLYNLLELWLIFVYLDLELSGGINIASDATRLVIEPAANDADKG